MAENIYYVDEYDQPTGETEEKLAAHNHNTKLHAAFSCYIFNTEGELLVTQRARSKKVWPGVWSNSFCGHPLPNESREQAIKRRGLDELGGDVTDMQLIVSRYIYETPPYNGVIEKEFCPIYFARMSSEMTANSEEIENYSWIKWGDYVRELQADSDDYSDPNSASAPKWSWWCKDQLKLLNQTQIASFLQSIE